MFAKMLAAVLFTGGVFADLPQSVPDQARSAASLLSAVTEASQSSRELPRLSDTADQSLISLAFNVEVLPEAASRGLDGILNVCGRAIQTVAVYALLGQSTDYARDETANMDQLEALLANSILYQDEVSLGRRFIMRCQAMGLPMMEPEIIAFAAAGKTEAQRGSAAQLRMDAAYALFMPVMMATSAGISPENADLLLLEAERQSPVLVQAMSLEHRQAVQRLIAARPRDKLSPEAALALDRVILNLGAVECGATCSF